MLPRDFLRSHHGREELRFKDEAPRFAEHRFRTAYAQANRSASRVPPVRGVDGPRARRAEHFRSGERADNANLCMPRLRHDDHEANTAGTMTAPELRGDGPRSEDLSSEHLSSEHLSSEQRRALAMLVGSPGGCTELVLRAHGFRPDFISHLVRAGLAMARPSLLRGAGVQSIGIIVVTITAKGRQAIAGDD